MNESGLSAAEWLAFGGNVAVTAGMLIWLFTHRNRVTFWSPPLFIAAIYFYYVLLGPFLAREFGDGFDRKLDMRPYYLPAWIASGVGLVCWIAGYYLRGRNTPRRQAYEIDRPIGLPELWRLSIVFNLIGLTSFSLTNGVGTFRLMNPFSLEMGDAGIAYGGALANYFGMAVNFLIPGCAILFLIRLRGYGSRVMVATWVVVAAGIYTSIGFRYRLVLLVAALTFVYYLHRRKRPNLLLFTVVATVFVMLMGYIGQTRNYGQGLNLEQSETTWSESLLSGFGEASIFATSGAVITHVPEDRPLIWAEPIKQSLIMPIPSSIYTEKATNAYMIETLTAIYGPDYYLGAAYMLFAECYEMFWWPGIILAHFGLGWLCRWLWEWYCHREGKPLAMLVYASALPFLYVVFSRGYLPQVVMLFTYTVLPAVVLYRWPAKVVRLTPSFGVKPSGRFRKIERAQEKAAMLP